MFQGSKILREKTLLFQNVQNEILVGYYYAAIIEGL